MASAFKLGPLAIVIPAFLAACSTGTPGVQVPQAPMSQHSCCETLPRTLYVALGEKVSNRYRGDVASYALPLVNGESPSTTFSGASLGVAAASGKLYVTNAASNPANNAFLSYKLPSSNGEKDQVRIGLAGAYAIAVSAKFVYVSSYTANTVSAYALPLVKGEAPASTITIPGVAQGNAVAV